MPGVEPLAEAPFRSEDFGVAERSSGRGRGGGRTASSTRPRQRAAELEGILARLTEQAGAGTAALVIQMDGLHVGGHAPAGLDVDLISALVVAAWADVQRLAVEGLDRALELVSLRAWPYEVTIMTVKAALFLTLWAPLDANSGAEWLALDEAASDLGRWLSRSLRMGGGVA